MRILQRFRRPDAEAPVARPDSRRSDPYDLHRFVVAQNGPATSSGVTFWRQAITELRAGKKRTHWMWFVFPQFPPRNPSETSERYGISSLQEARAYLEHPVLGQRLRLATATVASLGDATAEDVFGVLDARKLHSSMTLFYFAATGKGAYRDPQGLRDERLFSTVLDKFFGGALDTRTLARAGRS